MFRLKNNNLSIMERNKKPRRCLIPKKICIAVKCRHVCTFGCVIRFVVASLVAAPSHRGLHNHVFKQQSTPGNYLTHG